MGLMVLPQPCEMGHSHPLIHLYLLRVKLTLKRPATDTDDRYRWIATHLLPREGEVRGWLRRRVRTLSTADLDDVIQEAYARLWSADFSRIANPRNYFHSVARNVLLEQARRSRIVPMERLGEIEALRLVSEEPGPESQATVRQELERLWAAIATLPRQCREAFQLRTFQDCSRKEISERMGLSEKTVEKHLARALVRVSAELKQPMAQDVAPTSPADMKDHGP